MQTLHFLKYCSKSHEMEASETNNAHSLPLLEEEEYNVCLAFYISSKGMNLDDSYSFYIYIRKYTTERFKCSFCFGFIMINQSDKSRNLHQKLFSFKG